MEMEPPNKRKRRFMHAVKDHIYAVGLIEKDAMDRERWKQ